MRDTRPTELLDEKHHRTVAIEALLWTPPVTLSDVTADSPGSYVLLYSGALSLYDRLRPDPSRVQRRDPLVISGGAPLYVGKARSLGVRMSQHIKYLQSCLDVSSEDLMVIALPTASEAGALYIEGLLAAAYRPVWNQPWLSGFGSKPQGVTRTRHQRVPPWSVLHPGRRVLDERVHRPAREELRCRVTRHLAGAVGDVYVRGFLPAPPVS